MAPVSGSKTVQLAMSWQEACYARAPWLYLLAPFSVLFRMLASLRRSYYGHAKPRAVDAVPLVVVGNITVGGSGKTPLLLALAEELKRRGHRVAIVSRGYGGRPPSWPLLVSPGTPVAHCGDEPAMLARRLSVPVWVDPDRRRAAQQIEQDRDYACDIILSDDGLQHYALTRDLEVVVVDGVRGFGNGFCLPAGPLREPVSRLRQVDFVVSNGTSGQPLFVPGQQVVPMTLEPVACVNLKTGERLALKDFFRKQMLHAVAGIGNPSRFFAVLKSFGCQVIEHPFPDHHRYQLAELNFGDALPVVMTEKDAVKCQDFPLRNAWYLEVQAKLPDAFIEAFMARVTAIQSQRRIGVQRNLFDQ